MEHPLSSMDPVLVDGAPVTCSTCGAALCLRKQVVNLALGKDEVMQCLVCLGRDNGKSPLDVLMGLKSYILGRECFRKQWVRYEDVGYCPDREGCFPDSCFGAK